MHSDNSVATEYAIGDYRENSKINLGKTKIGIKLGTKPTQKMKSEKRLSNNHMPDSLSSDHDNAYRDKKVAKHRQSKRSSIV
jgi:hypothetical protein